MSEEPSVYDELYVALTHNVMLLKRLGEDLKLEDYTDEELTAVELKIVGELFKRGFYPKWEEPGEFYFVKEGEL